MPVAPVGGAALSPFDTSLQLLLCLNGDRDGRPMGPSRSMPLTDQDQCQPGVFSSWAIRWTDRRPTASRRRKEARHLPFSARTAARRIVRRRARTGRQPGLHTIGPSLQEATQITVVARWQYLAVDTATAVTAFGFGRSMATAQISVVKNGLIAASSGFRAPRVAYVVRGEQSDDHRLYPSPTMRRRSHPNWCNDTSPTRPDEATSIAARVTISSAERRGHGRQRSCSPTGRLPELAGSMAI